MTEWLGTPYKCNIVTFFISHAHGMRGYDQECVQKRIMYTQTSKQQTHMGIFM